ncbi:hypothetical protein LZ012_11540 [Dechloromonas sp. XY25]|uniref:Uncharacterized protein n=1 Tax=Dechloromonas hankyongensis TaxID=2908002 RepID=A0ABS9K3I5_9RHOO|nr:hypothetical protein [Dechloromonas hankyongensis]MCG2577625.1 hypothetical protein [Dechloromonas hankyongensis]
MLLQLAENFFHTLGREQLVGQHIQHRGIHLRHRHGRIATLVDVLGDAGITLVIAIAPTFPGGRGHAGIAAAAFDQASEQGIGTDNAWCHLVEAARGFALLYRIELFGLDDRLYLEQNPLRFRLGPFGLVFHSIEIELAHIGAVRQDFMHSATRPG